MTSAIRLRMLLVHDRPAIQSYDQDECARRLFYDRPIASSLEAFRLARVTSAEILDRLDEGAWTRAGMHPEHDRYTVEDWLTIYAAHAMTTRIRSAAPGPPHTGRPDTRARGVAPPRATRYD